MPKVPRSSDSWRARFGRKCNYRAHWIKSKPPLKNRGKYTKMAKKADALMITVLEIIYYLVAHQK